MTVVEKPVVRNMNFNLPTHTDQYENLVQVQSLAENLGVPTKNMYVPVNDTLIATTRQNVYIPVNETLSVTTVSGVSSANMLDKP